jgi:hypothetical protein
VYEIAIDERPTLDRIEGLGTGYDQLVFESEQYGDCVTYIANPAVIDETIEPMDWYKTMVLLGGRANRFPAEYLEFLDRFRATPDPDEARACMNWNIVKELRNGT